MPRASTDPRSNKTSNKTKKADPGKGKSGRPRKKKTKEKRRKAAPLAAKTLAKKPAKRRDKKKKGWVWSRTKRKAVRLILEGKQVKEIAKDCDIHRNTVRRWMQSPEFVTTLMTRLEEFKVSKRFARLKLTSKRTKMRLFLKNIHV